MNQNILENEEVSVDSSDQQKIHILVVDDDDRIRQLVSRYLKHNGYFVNTAADAAEAREILKSFSYDGLVLDIMMPGEDGIELTKTLREAGNTLPVLHLTALGETDDLVRGLESGADDYLAKPFEPAELIARLKALLRRRARNNVKQESFRIGPWTFHPESKDLVSAEGRVRLTDVEASLIHALARYRGEAVSREKLSALCEIDGSNRAIDVQVTRLRRKIEADPKNPRFIMTVRGKGYRLAGKR